MSILFCVLLGFFLATENFALYAADSELHPLNSESRTPNSQLLTPNSELRTPNSELLIPPLGLPPPVPIPATNLLTPEKIALGRRLFFDRRLSPNDTMSCAMCHIPAQG